MDAVLAVQRLTPVEVVFLDDHGGWESKIINVPEEIASTQSQDAFIKWVYSDSGADFRLTWADGTISVYVMSWRGDLQEPEWDDEPLFGRKAGYWQRFETETHEHIFNAWRDGIRSYDGVALYSEAEAELHFNRLTSAFTAAGGRGIALAEELDSLRTVLGLGE